MLIEETVSVKPALVPGKVLNFPEGIPGFETYTRFHVFHKEENEICAYWLESVDDPKITFTLVDPTTYDLHYEINLTEDEQEILQAERPDICGVFLILSKTESDGGKANIHANITGPLVINFENRTVIQKVITRSKLNVAIVGN